MFLDKESIYYQIYYHFLTFGAARHLGCCDIEKISNIDIEKKIPVISIFSIFFCCEIIRMKLGFLFREKH